MNIPVGLTRIAICWVGVFWIGGIAIPLTRIFYEIAGQGDWRSLFEPSILAVAQATLVQAIWSTLISGVCGLGLGLLIGGVLSQRRGRIPFLLQKLLVIPYGVPTVVAAACWVALLGRSGLLSRMTSAVGWSLDWAYSIKAVILAHVFFNIPLVALLVSEARRYLPQDQLEAVRTLGAGRFAEFRLVIWPQVRWAFASACAQVMSLCVMSFALVLVLGGGPPVETLETQLYENLRYGTVNISGAAVCAFWELVLALIPWALVLFLKRKQVNPILPKMNIVKSASSPIEKWMLGLCFAISSLLVLPYFSTLNSSILAFASFRGSEVSQALKTSLILAILSGLVTLVTAIASVIFLSTRKSVLTSIVGILLNIPSGVSVLVLGLGMWLAYGRWVDPFEGSLLAIVALQTVIFFPVSLRILWPVAQGVQRRELEAAATLGASPAKAFWIVEWPRWRTPVLSVFAATAGASLGEIGAVSLFYSENLISVPLLISRWMGRYRFEEAQGLAALLLILACALILVSGEVGEKVS